MRSKITPRPHTFHIPVMGTGYTIDSPLKVAHLGINSVVSLVDDVLIEKIHRHHCAQQNIQLHPVDKNDVLARAKRITAYLNFLDVMVRKNFESLKSDTKAIARYMALLPQHSPLRVAYSAMPAGFIESAQGRQWLEDNLMPGSIEVNVMTKLDRVKHNAQGEALPAEYNDAHTAVRGFAESTLNSSIVMSAGMNPRLYGYLSSFSDFYPDSSGAFKKKIVLKVSDYRSALIQGRFLAKKGLWVSEYRIESGLNCGGHAFATDGHLLGPIMAEFCEKRTSLPLELFDIYKKALAEKGLHVDAVPAVTITAQGGVGTAEEQQFLIDHYKVESVGWGTPFLLVPEVTNVDQNTRNQLITALEDDVELSNISPLGVPFNSLKANTKDEEKRNYIAKGRPGSPCPRKYIALNTDFTNHGICRASRQYQFLRLKQLDEEGLDANAHKKAYDAIVEKSCVCTGVGTSALIAYDIDHRKEGPGVSICPGPNIAYFSKELTLQEMVDHIYGRSASVVRADRPHMFVKELWIYVKFLKDQLEEQTTDMSARQRKYFDDFVANMKSGINYYLDLFARYKLVPSAQRAEVLKEIASANVALDAAMEKALACAS